MKDMENYDKISYYTYYSAVIGVITGSILFLLCVTLFDMRLMDTGLEDYKMNVVLNLPIVHLIFYIVKRRLGQILLFLIMITLFSYPFTAAIFNILFGIYYGMVTCNLFIKFGMMGICYSFSCFFPHYLIYFLVIYFWGKWFYGALSRKDYYFDNVNKLQNFVKFFVMFFMIFLAVVWELKFQKNILNYFYQYLV